MALDRVGIDAAYSAEGSWVLGLVADGPSACLLHPDDVIVSVDGGEVAMPDDIAGELDDRSPGDTVDVVVERDGPEPRDEDDPTPPPTPSPTPTPAETSGV